MKKVHQVVFIAAALVALSGLAYSESSYDELVETGTGTGSGMSSPAESRPAGIDTEMDMESPPGPGGDIERGDYPSSSPGGMMGSYSSARKGGHRMYPAGEHEERHP